jgi:hypothetical protein
MFNARRNGWCRQLAGAAAITTTALTVAAFVAPSGQAAFAAGTTTTTTSTTTSSTTTTSPTTTKATDYNCAASVDQTVLSRSGWTATANSPAGSDAPSEAIDGNLTTRFSSNEDQVAGVYFEVDLGASQSFNELQMEVPNSKSDYARSYTIEDSENGISWSAVANCAGASDAEVVSFPVQTARYVRVVLVGGADFWWSIDEFYPLRLDGQHERPGEHVGFPFVRPRWQPRHAIFHKQGPDLWALLRGQHAFQFQLRRS